MTDDSGLNRLDRWGRSVAPLLSVVLLILLSVTKLPLPYYATVAPFLPLMGIYCWIVLRPELVPRTVVFALGLVHDALIGLPLGVMALVYLAAHPVLTAQRRFLIRHSFLSYWWGFALFAPTASFLTWLLLSLLRGGLIPPAGALSELLAGILVFPLVAWALSKGGTLTPAPVEGSYAPTR